MTTSEEKQTLSLKYPGDDVNISTSLGPNICLDVPLTVFYVSEFLVEAMSAVNAVMMVVALHKIGTMHINFKLICSNMCVCLVLRAITRFLLITNYLNCCNVYSQEVQFWIVFALNILNVAALLIETSIVTERTMSWVLTRSYETYYSRSFISLIITLPYISSTALDFVVSIFDLIKMMTANYILISMFFVTFTALLVVVRLNKKADKLISRNKSLSERYQQHENLKTNKTMIYMFVFSMIHLVFGSAAQFGKALTLSIRPAYQQLYLSVMFNGLVHWINAFMFFLFPFVFVFTIDKIKERYLQLIPCLHLKNRKKNRVEPECTNLVILSVAGERLEHESTPENHFNSLMTYWNQY